MTLPGAQLDSVRSALYPGDSDSSAPLISFHINLSLYLFHIPFLLYLLSFTLTYFLPGYVVA